MCSRFELNTSPRDLARQFGLSAAPAMTNQAEVRPTDMALVIDGSRAASFRIWGIPAPWDGKPVFNARAETLLEKPIFRPYLTQRCIMPATCFPEWRKVGKTRYRNLISLDHNGRDNSHTMAFAGLMNETHATIITCPAAPRMAHVHGRMPVILSDDNVAAWLDPAPIEARVSVLLPYVGDDLQVIEDDPVPPKQPDLFTDI